MFCSFNTQLDQLFLAPLGITNCVEIGVVIRKTQNLSAIKNLPGGKDLVGVGSGLQTFLIETLERYACDDIAQKIAPLGSTQRNECLNGIIASKNLKIRFYGGSEISDYRTAAAIAQFNEGYSYLSMVMDKLNHRSNLHFLTKYIGKYNVKRHRQAMNQKTTVFKKNRKERTKLRKQKDQKKERMEGTTYESGFRFE